MMIFSHFMAGSDQTENNRTVLGIIHVHLLCTIQLGHPANQSVHLNISLTNNYLHLWGARARGPCEIPYILDVKYI